MSHLSHFFSARARNPSPFDRTHTERVLLQRILSARLRRAGPMSSRRDECCCHSWCCWASWAPPDCCDWLPSQRPHTHAQSQWHTAEHGAGKHHSGRGARERSAAVCTAVPSPSPPWPASRVCAAVGAGSGLPRSVRRRRAVTRWSGNRRDTRRDAQSTLPWTAGSGRGQGLGEMCGARMRLLSSPSRHRSRSGAGQAACERTDSMRTVLLSIAVGDSVCSPSRSVRVR
jgi:hypothetical protein